jgi:deoxyribonuclease-4
MIKFGVAGYPPAFGLSPFKKNRMNIFEWIHSLGLDAFEAQMTYGPRTTKENCKEIKRISESFGIKVSVHASYFIVFTSNNTQKIAQSVDTLLRTYELADLMAADVIVLHPGPLYNLPPENAIKRIKDNLNDFFHTLGKSTIGLFLETAGKKGQLGSVDEIIELTSMFDGCYPCFDFGHIHARTGGTLASNQSIDDLFNYMQEKGAFAKERIHFHYTPIHYGSKGEICHMAIDDRIASSNQLSLSLFDKPADDYYHPRFPQIVTNLAKLGKEFTVISETHNSQEEGALAMKNHYALAAVKA